MRNEVNTMGKGSKKFVVGVMFLCILLTQMLFASAAYGKTYGLSKSDRLSGSDRYKTAVAISKAGWPNGSDYAIIATGEKFADALCAVPLAAEYDAPILLTNSNSLNADTRRELRRLGVDDVIIVGGNSAVSRSVERAIEREGIDVKRIEGDDRYETSVEIAKELGDVDRIVVATGEDFPDALSISPIAAQMGMPILLTGKNSLPNDVRRYINRIEDDIDVSYVIGGTGVISESVRRALPHPDRIGGGDRYKTNLEVMKEFESKLDFTKVYVAIGGGPRGNEFADALAGAVLAAKTSSPLVLAYKSVPKDTGNYLKKQLSFGCEIIALGGTSSVPTSVLNTITGYVDDIDVEEVYDDDGTYGPSSGTKTIYGNVVIDEEDVKLRNMRIRGDVLITENVGRGDVYFENVRIDGTLYIRGGGSSSIEGEDLVVVNGAVISVPSNYNVRFVLTGDSDVDEVTMLTNGTLDDSGCHGDGFYTVYISDGDEVTLDGSFGTVEVNSPGIEIELTRNSSISTLRMNSSGDVTGDGEIDRAYINSNGVEIEQRPERIYMGRSVDYVRIDGSRYYDEDDYEDDEDDDTLVKSISISGNPIVGTKLEAVGLSPSYAKVNYQWQKSEDNNGSFKNITGATSVEYEIRDTDLGDYIRVRVTGRNGYTGTKYSQVVGPVVSKVSRSDGEVIQDAGFTGGKSLYYSFVAEGKVLTINAKNKKLPYYEVAGSTPPRGANWVGVAIPVPDGVDTDKVTATINGKVCTNLFFANGMYMEYIDVKAADLKEGKATYTWVIKWGSGYADEAITIKLTDVGGLDLPAQSTYKITYTGLKDSYNVGKLIEKSGMDQAAINKAVEEAIDELDPIKVTISPDVVGKTGYNRVRIEPVNAGEHIQLWAEDTNGNWYNINKTGWGDLNGFELTPDYSATTDIYLISDAPANYMLNVKLVDLEGERKIIAETCGILKVEGEENPLKEVIEAYSISATYSDGTITAAFKDYLDSLPEVAQNYKIDVLIDLGTELPVGTDISVTYNGDSVPVRDNWKENIFRGNKIWLGEGILNIGGAKPFTAGEPGTWGITISGNEKDINTTVIIQSAISNDNFKSWTVIAEAPVGINLPAKEN